MSGIRTILTDIEGTTSSIAFVTDALFPYARARIEGFLRGHPEETRAIVAEVEAEAPGVPAAETLRRWIDEDRKAPALKALQGMIWAEGYADGSLSGHVYPDAAQALRRWHATGLRLFVFSSGSVEAQKLIFGHSDQGDLAPLFSGWFDLATGPKREPASYTRIAAAIGAPAGAILFLSDVAAETEAAAVAGMAVRLIDRAAGDSFAAIDPAACC